MVGKTIAHYKVLGKLGEGGMGVVYTAEDTRLQRTVALKFLPHGTSGDEKEQERLLHEARAAATLNHPNICTIYSVEEAEGERFIVMEYVKGMHLRDKVQAGEMSAEEALDYAIQSAEALKEAHSQGVVHRDIKTENIMVNERGQVKVMDFGLAKLKGALRLTKSRSTVGTLAYMSPEQIDGRDVDARSDIFSLGVVLYELLSGKYPFRGEHEAAMVYSVMNEEPEPVQKHIPEASSELIHIFNRALEKDPEDRYQSVQEMLIDMRRLRKDPGRVSGDSIRARPTRTQPVPKPGGKAPRWRLPLFAALGIIALVAAGLLFLPRPGEKEATVTPSGRKTVMILPFVNRGAPEDAYFAAGLTDEIQNRLTPVYGIALISRITADQYGESTKTPQQIREETGADYLLRGNVQWSRSGDAEGRVKVTMQLVRTTDDRQIWSESYERGMAGVFEVQSEIADAVIKKLDLAIAERERELMLRSPTDNPEAYQLFLKGVAKWRESLYRGSPLSGLDSAVALHRQATVLDTSFAQAYAGIAFVNSWAYHIGDRTPERLDVARRAMERALELDPDDPRTRITHAWYQYRMFRDYERALEECEAAQKALPNAILDIPAFIWRRQGKIRRATEQLEKRFELNPRDSDLASEIGGCYVYAGDYEKGVRWYDRALTIAPENKNARLWKAHTLILATGRTAEARQVAGPVDQSSAESLSLWRLVLEVDRDFGAYLGIVDTIAAPIIKWSEGVSQRDLERAREYHFMGNEALTVTHAQKAMDALTAELSVRPADARIHLAVGYAHAFLDDRSAALAAGRRALDLAPMSLDALVGAGVLRQHAEIAALAGEVDEAIRTLEELRSTPVGGWEISVRRLEVEPSWDSLRDNPRFKRLLAE